MYARRKCQVGSAEPLSRTPNHLSVSFQQSGTPRLLCHAQRRYVRIYGAHPRTTKAEGTSDRTHPTHLPTQPRTATQHTRPRAGTAASHRRLLFYVCVYVHVYVHVHVRAVRVVCTCARVHDGHVTGQHLTRTHPHVHVVCRSASGKARSTVSMTTFNMGKCAKVMV